MLGLESVYRAQGAGCGCLGPMDPEGPYTIPLWNQAPKAMMGMVFGYLIPYIMVVYMDPLG